MGWHTRPTPDPERLQRGGGEIGSQVRVAEAIGRGQIAETLPVQCLPLGAFDTWKLNVDTQDGYWLDPLDARFFAFFVFQDTSFLRT